MLSPDDSPIRGYVDKEGRLLEADPELASLQERAGGKTGGPLAVPQLAALARLVRRLSIPIARAVLAADGEEDLDLWVQGRPEKGGTALTIANWTRRSSAPPLLDPRPGMRDYDFVRAAADWIWEADATLRLVALSSEGVVALGANAGGPAIGDPLTRVFVLDEADNGGLPLLEAFAQQRGFDNQSVTLRGTNRRFRLAGAPLQDLAGRIVGFRGAGFTTPGSDPANETVAQAGFPGTSDKRAFSRRLDTALRGPIHRIVASAEQIREQAEGPVRADYSNYAGDIADAGRHLLGLIEDLVDLEMVERETIPVEREPLDLADLARRATGLLSVRAHIKDIRLEQPEISEALAASGDFKRTLQVLVNLVSNAVRYGPQQSSVRVSVEVQGTMACVIVADQGRGIPPDSREKVFEKFERLNAREPGSGLGLYISRRLARAMGGDIRIEGGVGEGARVIFTLPRAPSE